MTETKSEFCAAPFVQMMLRPDGAVTPCCYLYNFKVGDLRKNTYAEIWNGTRMQKLRKEFLLGEIKTCRSRQKNLDCQTSFAHLEAKASRNEVVQGPIQRLDLRLNSYCNLSCVMCDVWRGPSKVYDQTTFWSEGEREIFPHIKECDLLGGEPLLQQDTFRLVELIRRVNKACTFAFVTNAQFPFSKRLEVMLLDLPLRYIQVSIDSLIPEVYAAIRKGGALDLTLDTLDKISRLREKRTPFRIIVSMCILKQNWREIPAFEIFARERGYETDFQFAFYDASRESSLLYASPSEKLSFNQSQRYFSI